MAPGKQEDMAGRPFIGPAGDILKAALAKAGFPMDDIAYTNPACCYPGRGVRGDHKPTLVQLQRCAPNLLDQIEVIQPRYILLFGGTALEAFRPDLSMEYVRGRPMFFPNPRPHPHPQYIWTTRHPAATFRSKRYEIDMADDLDLFQEWRRSGEEWPEDCIKCHRPFEHYDEWGMPTCATHSMRQGELQFT